MRESLSLGLGLGRRQIHGEGGAICLPLAASERVGGKGGLRQSQLGRRVDGWRREWRRERKEGGEGRVVEMCATKIQWKVNFQVMGGWC